MRQYGLWEYIGEIHRERKVPRELVIKALREAISKALAKNFPECPIHVEVDPKKGKIDIFVEKNVVEGKVEDPRTQISLDDARQITPSVIPGGTVKVPVRLEDMDRGTIYRLQNIFTQRIRDAVRENILREYQGRIGELVKGKVQKVDSRGVVVSLPSKVGIQAGAEGLIPPEEQIPGERYRQGSDVRALVLSAGGGERHRNVVLLSRTHPDFLRKLMEEAIEEIKEGRVEIKAVARIPGLRAKVAVASREPMVDPVGACVGRKGVRILSISRELAGEAIDVVRWSSDPIRYALNALSPAEAITVYPTPEGTLVAIVDDGEVDKAKGERGANVRLASSLVGRTIEIKPKSEYEPVPGVVTLLDLAEELPPPVIKSLRAKSMVCFTSVPTLAAIHAAIGMDEGTSLKVLSIIEEKLVEHGQT